MCRCMSTERLSSHYGHSMTGFISKMKVQVHVNRAPVITLWAAAVAQRQGFSRDAALTFGKYISGMLAQSKGRAIGIYEDKGKSEEEQDEAQRKEQEAGIEHVDVFGMKVKAVKVSRKHQPHVWHGLCEGQPSRILSETSSCWYEKHTLLQSCTTGLWSEFLDLERMA